MAMFRLVLLAALLGLCLAKKRYDGYKVLRVTPTEDFEVQSIAELKRHLEDRVDFWTEPRAPGAPVDLMVAPGDLDFVQALLSEHGLTSTVTIEDVQKLIDETSTEQGGIAAVKFNYDWYHPFDEIMTWMNDMATEHSIAVRQDLPGTSTEGRKLSYLKIGKTDPSKPNKPIFWLMSGTHAREWLASASVISIVSKLVTDYEKKVPDVVTLLDEVDFYIMPISNPDGYVYSFEYDRLWRKTRSWDPTFSWCVGTDPNRNWDDHWDAIFSETWPCASTYRGTSIFSEPETKLLSQHIQTLSNVQAFMDVHAYGQMWMTPYGWTYGLPSTYKDMKSLADKAVAALKSVHGVDFETGSIANVIYLAAGSSVDWAYSEANIPYSYALEIRDTGDGFVASKGQIDPSSEELYAAIKVVGNHIIPKA